MSAYTELFLALFFFFFQHFKLRYVFVCVWVVHGEKQQQNHFLITAHWTIKHIHTQRKWERSSERNRIFELALKLESFNSNGFFHHSQIFQFWCIWSMRVEKCIICKRDSVHVREREMGVEVVIQMPLEQIRNKMFIAMALWTFVAWFLFLLFILD